MVNTLLGKRCVIHTISVLNCILVCVNKHVIWKKDTSHLKNCQYFSEVC